MLGGVWGLSKVSANPHPVQTTAPTSGLYEQYCPLLRAPCVKLDPAWTQKLPRWLEVKTTGNLSEVTFQPHGKIRWKLEYGPRGLVRKTTLVEGEVWTRSEFGYDARGHLQRKTVVGPGAAFSPPESPFWDAGLPPSLPSTKLMFVYQTDKVGRVLSRAQTFPGKAKQRTIRWEVKYKSKGGAIAVWKNPRGKVVRRDQFDANGYLTRTEFSTEREVHTRASNTEFVSKTKTFSAALVYKRTKRGDLKSIHWHLGSRKGNALPIRRDPKITTHDLYRVVGSVIERHEVLLLLGEPVTHSIDEQGKSRTTYDSYTKDCWMDEISAFTYDAADLLRRGSDPCICGFCVDAALSVEATDVNGVDLHWTEGEWVRFDHEVDVTADHFVFTPDGPRAAGELVAGDIVLDALGQPRILRSVQRLQYGTERLGRNVRTKAGYFAAGNILFQSEQGQECPVPQRH